MFRVFAAALLVTLTACSSSDVRVTTSSAAQPVSSERVRIAHRSVEVATVTMPAYAVSEEIFVQRGDGTLGPLGPLWSDEPSRAMTMQIAADLSTITNRVIAPDPWPFRDVPDARLDVRIEDFYATSAGNFRLSGQYFVAPEDGGRNVVRSFAYEVPMSGGRAVAIADARRAAVSLLIAEVARVGLQ